MICAFVKICNELKAQHGLKPESMKRYFSSFVFFLFLLVVYVFISFRLGAEISFVSQTPALESNATQGRLESGTLP